MLQVSNLNGSASKLLENAWLKNAEERVCTSKIELEGPFYSFKEKEVRKSGLPILSCETLLGKY